MHLYLVIARVHLFLFCVDRSLSSIQHGSNENEDTSDEDDQQEYNNSHKNRYWSYEGLDGPFYWPELDLSCHGMRQSPINIITQNTILDPRLKGIAFEGYDLVPPLGSMKLVNNGHTIKMEFNEDLNITILDGDFKNKYKFAQLHFHWGELGEHGSEHNINGKSFAMELHLVHYLNSYKSLQDAMIKKNGLAVIGILIEVGSTMHVGLDNIVKDLHRVMFKEENVILKRTFPLENLLPSNKEYYYRYHGSLTTPNCFETVIWTVMAESIKVSQIQLSEFLEIRENLLGNQEKELKNNYRPPQQINSRKIFHSVGTASTLRQYQFISISIILAIKSIL